MNLLTRPFKHGRRVLIAPIFALALLACSAGVTFAADSKPSDQKQLSAEDKLSLREVQLTVSKAQSRVQEVIQQAQQELATAQQALQLIIQEVEKKCGGKVNELTAGNGKSELVCTAGITIPDSAAGPK